jgi:hypothetical protein
MLEPFLVNPPVRRRKKKKNPPSGRKIVVFNPRKKRKIKRLHRREGTKKMKHRTSRKRRRNPVVLGANPRRRHYRGNPGVKGMLKALPLPSVKKFIGLGLGAVAAGLAVPQIFKRVPLLSGNVVTRVLTRLGVVAILGMVAKKVGPLKAHADNIIDGATVTQIFPIVNELAAVAKLPIRLGQDEEGEMALGYFTEDETMSQDAPEIGMGIYTEQNTELEVG